MPQGRRKVPFSAKAKKEQLKLKKQNKSAKLQGNPSRVLLKHSDDETETATNTQKINYQPKKGSRSRPNRYALELFRESDEEVKRQKEKAYESVIPASETELEVNGDDFFLEELSFPKRPLWSYDLSKDQLEAKEQKYFTEYISNIQQKFDQKDLSYFELNLETWRQLWRVLEMSDIILFIVDIRFPAVMFPPSLYEYVIDVLHKDFILVINKIDLVPADVVVAWKRYFIEKYPNLHIVLFTTVPGYNLVGNQADKAGLQIRKRKGRLRMATEGTTLLLNACKTIVAEEVDLSSWEQKIKKEMNEDFQDDDKVEIDRLVELKNVDTDYYEHEKYKNGILTIGCLGQPNVGKSSIMNAIMGKHVVSVSKTPGHTKHFQTIFLTPNVRLCDCPGLIFPSKVPKVIQILMGSYPIAQLREPFTTVKYLAQYLDLPKLLRISHPHGDDTWSAMDVCEGWAKKRGFLTAKAGRLDSYRAANAILRMALEGRICLYLRPPKYFVNKDFFIGHPDVQKVKWVQAKPHEIGDFLNACPLQQDSSETESEDEIEDDESNSTNEDDSEGGTESGEGPIQTTSNKFSVLQE